MIVKKNLAERSAAFEETWSPRVVGEINNMQVKLIKLEGEFIWHRHDEEDELFLVVSGRLRMEFREQEAEIVEPHVQLPTFQLLGTTRTEGAHWMSLIRNQVAC